MTDGDRFVGVDRAAGNWVAVGHDGGGAFDVAVYADVEALWDACGETAARIVVDVPVGLCGSFAASGGAVETDGELSRRCDDLARSVLGRRSSSVFTPPAREVVRMAADGADYDDCNRRNRELTGKGLMVQAMNIADGIAAVDELLRGRGDPAVLVEGHPEVCFRAFAGEPLADGKTSAAGVEERLAALERVPEYERGAWRDVARSLRAVDASVGLDDALDAVALALTAAADDESWRTLPPEPPADEAGLPVQMAYRSATPLVDAA